MKTKLTLKRIHAIILKEFLAVENFGKKLTLVFVFGLFSSSPLSKYRVLCLFYVLLRLNAVQNCRFVHHAKFHCIVTTLNRLFKIEFERGGGGGEGLEKSPYLF